jgi:hypothetical protein
MPGKKLSALIAVALLSASTAGVAQSSPAPAPEPTTERLSTEDGSALSQAQTVGGLFALLAIIVLIWKLGDKDPLVPNSP